MAKAKENSEPNVAILTNPEKTTMYIDNINITGSEGVVFFDFMQVLPGTVKIEEGKELRQAAIVSRIAITTQHFRRFVDACENVLSDIDSSEQKAEEEK